MRGGKGTEKQPLLHDAIAASCHPHASSADYYPGKKVAGTLRVPGRKVARTLRGRGAPHTECAGYFLGSGMRSVPATFKPRHAERACYFAELACRGKISRRFGHRNGGAHHVQAQ